MARIRVTNLTPSYTGVIDPSGVTEHALLISPLATVEFDVVARVYSRVISDLQGLHTRGIVDYTVISSPAGSDFTYEHFMMVLTIVNLTDDPVTITDTIPDPSFTVVVAAHGTSDVPVSNAVFQRIYADLEALREAGTITYNAVSVDEDLVLSDSNVQSVVTIRGLKGDKGDPGDSGNSSGSLVTDYFTYAGGPSVLILSQTPVDAALVILVVNGQEQIYGSDYTVVGQVLTWVSSDFPFTTGDKFAVHYSV